MVTAAGAGTNSLLFDRFAFQVPVKLTLMWLAGML